MKMKHRILKALSWRLVGTMEVFGISYVATGHVSAASMIAGIQAALSTVLYIAHDKAWEMVGEKGAA